MDWLQEVAPSHPRRARQLFPPNSRKPHDGQDRPQIDNAPENALIQVNPKCFRANPWGLIHINAASSASVIQSVASRSERARAASMPRGINYKMNPENVACLTAAEVDYCVLANNHVLDFATTGLCETLEVLEQVGIRSAGAGRNTTEAQGPVVIETTNAGRVLVFAFGCGSSGIPPDWAASRDRPGVNLLGDLSDRTVAAIAEFSRAARREGDILVASIHWGGNWSYEIGPHQVRFSHGLIDVAGFSVVHGHSSHHPKAIEVYRDRPIFS
jgi:poly-gamma-glutamate capsule biosynthesis protein CapA/YwtB (metallophosphatase superfamily)